MFFTPPPPVASVFSLQEASVLLERQGTRSPPRQQAAGSLALMYVPSHLFSPMGWDDGIVDIFA